MTRAPCGRRLCAGPRCPARARRWRAAACRSPLAGLLHPANPDQAVAALDREVEAVAAEDTPGGIHLDRDFHGFPRVRVLDIRVIAVQLPPYLAVVENEDGSPAQAFRQLD